jgi:type IV secretory pathway VirB10-like protein
MSASAAVFSSGRRPVPGAALALAVSLALHLLAALLWVQAPRPPVADAPRSISILLAPPAPPRVREEPPSQPPPRPRPRPADLTPHLAAPTRSPALPSAAPVTPAPAAQAEERRDDQVPAAAPGLDEARAPVDVRQAIRDQAAADGGFGLALSRRQAGRIDRELRKGKSGVPDEPDTPMGRFRRGLESAHVERSMSVREDSYTAPDGTIIYRKRIGKATICRRSGSVSPLGMRGMLFGNEAGEVRCPTGVQWKED